LVRIRGIVTLALVCLICAGCGQLQAATPSSGARHPAPSTPETTAAASGLRAHPQAIEPVAGAGAHSVAPAPAAPTDVSVSPTSGVPLPQPVSNAQIRQQLAQSGMSASPNQATLTPQGLAVAPIDAPAAVQAVITAGNEIARLPYRYGGGHLTYEDTAYDCSGSISYVFAAAGLLNRTVVSGQLENWGDPGPGKWITVFANAGHTFMYVAGLRFDTVALAETGSRWSDTPANEPDLSTFSVRHPVGL
jgi:cell wall-associated NlpC family hydrolase